MPKWPENRNCRLDLPRPGLHGAFWARCLVLAFGLVVEAALAHAVDVSADEPRDGEANGVGNHLSNEFHDPALLRWR